MKNKQKMLSLFALGVLAVVGAGCGNKSGNTALNTSTGDQVAYNTSNPTGTGSTGVMSDNSDVAMVNPEQGSEKSVKNGSDQLATSSAVGNTPALSASGVAASNKATGTQASPAKSVAAATSAPSSNASRSNASVSISSAAANTKNYENLLADYRDSGYYIQFATCQARPGSLNMKKGTKFMLDNRGDQARTIKFAGNTYHIPAYGYAVVTANEVGSFRLTCDGGGSADLKVQE